MIVILFGVCITNQSFAATPTLTANEDTANVVVGTANQTDSMASTTDNVVEVKATRTLNVSVAPVNTNTIVVGTCTVTFATTTAGNGTEDTNCTGGATVLTTTNTVADTTRTPAQIATVLRTLTNLSDTGHGTLALTNGTSTTSIIVTTSGTEATTTAITFTDGTSGKITSLSSTNGTVPVVQINTITIAGTVDSGDVFSVILPGPVTASYTVISSDSTTSHIATGLNAAIQASADYSSQAFTSVASTNTVVLTAKAAGTGFVPLTPTTSNRAAVAQVVTFTPSTAGSSYQFSITINGSEYKLKRNSVKELVEEFVTLLNSNSAISCTENDISLTCTADVAGTAFTYSANVDGSSSGGGGGSSHRPASRPASPIPAIVATLVTPGIPGMAITTGNVGQQISAIARTLQFGTTGDDVKLAQTLLAKDPTLYPEGLTTGYFGALTRAAVQRFQEKYGIATPATIGYGWVGPRTKAKLAEIFGQ